MSALAAVTLRRQGAPGLQVAYADAVAELPIGPDGKRQRRNAAGRLLAICPTPEQWMTRPTPTRLADIYRTGAWTFLAWCFTEGHLRPDLDLLLAKLPGGLYQAWAARHPGDIARIADVAGRFGWSANWTRDVSGGGLALICLTAGKGLDGLTDEDFAVFARDLAAAPSAGPQAWTHNSSRAFSSTRPATNCGSASSRRGWPGPAKPALSSARSRSPSRVSARPRYAT